jgi:hypothetical protein
VLKLVGDLQHVSTVSEHCSSSLISPYGHGHIKPQICNKKYMYTEVISWPILLKFTITGAKSFEVLPQNLHIILRFKNFS